MQQYIVVQSTRFEEKETSKSYGIAFLEPSDDDPLILQSYIELSTDAARVIELVKLCNKLALAPCQLQDVIDDFMEQ